MEPNSRQAYIDSITCDLKKDNVVISEETSKIFEEFVKGDITQDQMLRYLLTMVDVKLRSIHIHKSDV